MSEARALGIPLEPGRESVIVSFDLPYCLYLADDVYVVQMPNVLVECKLLKTWREPTNGEKVNNAEIQNDPRGTYRYTSAQLAFTVAEDEDPAEVALDTINRVVDVYRFATGRSYLHPLSNQDLSDLRVERPRYREIVATMVFGGGGIGAAYPDDTNEVHAMVDRMLRSADLVPLHVELLHSAERLNATGYQRSAVIDCVSAVEVFVWELLRLHLGAKGMGAADIEELLDRNVLSDLMKKPMEDAIGWRASNDNALWQDWLWANGIRRGATHKGATVASADAVRVIDVVKRLIDTVDQHTP